MFLKIFVGLLELVSLVVFARIRLPIYRSLQTL